MGVERYYKILVVGGALLNAGCGASQTPVAEVSTDRQAQPAAAPVSQPDAAPVSQRPSADECTKVCSGDPSSGVICPDPNQNELENCCWLMSPRRHPCCPS